MSGGQSFIRSKKISRQNRPRLGAILVRAEIFVQLLIHLNAIIQGGFKNGTCA